MIAVDTSWINVLIGGAGVAILAAVAKFINDMRQSRIMRDDTAIARWKELRDEKAREAARAWRQVDWYRSQYPRLLYEFERYAPPERRGQYPPAPPPESE